MIKSMGVSSDPSKYRSKFLGELMKTIDIIWTGKYRIIKNELEHLL